MSKQIPELTIITTPTAGQESIIETVVARHDTYATSRMTLAQIFTLASISGSIKVALDALSGLISGNTTSINTLSSTKLNIAWGTRTGLTADKLLRSNHTGVEEWFSGTTVQVVWFDANGMPIPVTPTVDINGLTEKTSTIGATDMLMMYDVAGGANKKHLAQASVTNEGLVEMCTDAEVVTHTDQTRYINAKQAYDMRGRYIWISPNDMNILSGSATLSQYGWNLSASNDEVSFSFPVSGSFTGISSIQVLFYTPTTLSGNDNFTLVTQKFRNASAVTTTSPGNQSLTFNSTAWQRLDYSLPSALFSGVTLQDNDWLRMTFRRVIRINYAADINVTGIIITLS
jgi:hypothetical protein